MECIIIILIEIKILLSVAFIAWIKLQYYDTQTLKFPNDNEIDITKVKFSFRNILEK